MEIFHSFLGNESTKEISLLQVLYSNHRFMDIDELTTALNMDRRSIYKYFGLLLNKPYIEDQKPKEILLSKHGQGYKFCGNKKDYKILYSQIIQANPFFELIESLLLTNEINITKFSYDNFISASNIRKRLSDLAALFEEFGFSIKKSAGHARIIGEEAKVRFFMVSFFWKIYHGLHWPFSGVSRIKCERLITDIYQKNQIKHNEIGVELSCYVLAVNIIRFRKGFIIEQSTLERVKKSNYIDQRILAMILNTDNDLLQALSTDLHTNYLLTPSEIEFLLLWFFTNSTFYLLNKSISNYLNTYSLEEGSLSQPAVNIRAILTDLYEDFDSSRLSVTTKQVLLSSIFAGCFSVELFGRTKYTLTGYDIEAYIQKNFPSLLSRVSHTMEDLNIFPKDADRRAGLALEFAIAATVIETPSTFSQVIKIKLETDLPAALEFGIIKRIQTTFSSFYNLELSSTIPNEEADFFLSTHSLSEASNPNETLLIKAQVSASDLLAIHRKIVSILELKKDNP
ncbi:helix-turn-helix domain-containing protein [Enterococcus raffinosus]|uniref:Helix-turn-helix domain-containing protein n=1 Tax=Enterococcus raffinosus TaxID=71452 RepID=A0AAW8T973_9ENTE|nr:helix-turn-helix domain-containing protein [Enterococcus raffinosus]MDT2523747.1 helix-turn-helix domain-containing protein [Enterococcus raffinosus]MDT2529716.1 helix-turn-helix domain-containing protein [Enterococcus raffinosus]MDT2534272.1 helix-turn-helix domain-containing protein [Enterococcus raffinosus]MDT2544884.1 helix-turn-helix domain-containing protein [Enterococcus raffinosus]MDT2556830.1 helix-turn-helix domain-containing protein [Enterococcus raffinosus]